MWSDFRVDLVRGGPRSVARKPAMTTCDAPFRVSVTVK
jgi:hypothetical protein